MSALVLTRVLAAQRSAIARRAFSTARPLRSASNPGRGGSDNVEIPAFSLKNISTNRRTRVYVAAALLTLGFIEGAAWMKFWPHIFGKEGKEGEETKFE